jgi:RNA polymerase sigma-70 factor (ECF subfamily)
MHDQETFMDLLQPNLAPLNRFVLVSVRNTFEADDIVQETVYKAFVHFNDFRGESKFKTWLMTIALNEVRSRRRKEARSRTSYFETDQLEIVAGASSKDSPVSEYDKGQRIKQLHSAISSLRPKDREVVQLRSVKGLTIADTARQLSISRAAVKSRYHRALHRLRSTICQSAAPVQGRLSVVPKTSAFPRESPAGRKKNPMAA